VRPVTEKNYDLLRGILQREKEADKALRNARTRADYFNAITDQLAILTLRKNVEDGLKAAFAVNFAIYDDLAWVHFAYADKGLKELVYLNRGGQLDDEVLAAFKKNRCGRSKE
jgi:hypothetical protein